MLNKQTVALVCSAGLILVLTGSIVRTSANNPVLGSLAPLIVPALLTWFLIMFLAYCKSIIEMLAAFLVSHPDDQTHRDRSLLATVLAWVIVLGFVGVALRLNLIQGIVGAFRDALGFFPSTLKMFSQTNQANASPPSAGSLFLLYYSILIFGAIILLSFSFVFAAMHKAYRFAREFPVSNEDFREEVLNAVQQARARLEAHEETHETILNCYKQMCGILSGQGHVIKPEQTPREFAENLSGKLKLGFDSVRGLTFLFEEARYSHHMIADRSREMAVRYLNSIEQALTGIGAKA